MNRRNHIANAVLLAVGLAILSSPVGWTDPIDPVATTVRAVALGVPIVLGALVPDLDCTFGRHRKTLHNLPVLVGFAAFPAAFGNLSYVWIGVAAHYVLDAVGSRRGLALLYPLTDREYGIRRGPDSAGAAFVLVLIVTAVEIAAVVALTVLLWA